MDKRKKLTRSKTQKAKKLNRKKTKRKPKINNQHGGIHKSFPTEEICKFKDDVCKRRGDCYQQCTRTFTNIDEYYDQGKSFEIAKNQKQDWVAPAAFDIKDVNTLLNEYRLYP